MYQSKKQEPQLPVKNAEVEHLLMIKNSNNQENSNIQYYPNEKRIQDKLRQYVCCEQQNRYSIQSKKAVLKKPYKGGSKLSIFKSMQQKLKIIMLKAYNYQELKQDQFKQLQQVFKLDKKQFKLMNFPDPVVLQILRYAIFNKQQIPYQLVKVVIQMAKTSMVKDYQISDLFSNYTVMFGIISEEFEPPLDLYVEFLQTGLIKESEQELNLIFTKNQYLFIKFQNKREFYSTVSQKKRLIYNQFPYLIDIFYRVSIKNPSEFNFDRLQLYINTVINFLQFPGLDYMFQRYLPEVRIKYLKIKPDLSPSDIQYLFLALKGINSLSLEDFKFLYRTKTTKNPQIKQHKIKSIRKFEKIEQICTKVLIRKQYHLTKQQLEQIGELLNYQKCYSQELIIMDFVFFILREEAYRNQQFSQPLINNISWVLENIPDKKKRRQSCYILFLQYFKEISESNNQIRGWILKQCNFPQSEVDIILDEGRQLALDILMKQSDNKLTLGEQKYVRYKKILQQVVIEARNETIKKKSLQLELKLDKINKFQNQDLQYYQQNLIDNNQYIEFLEESAKNGRQIDMDSIPNILKIVLKNNNPSIRKSCLSTLKYAIKNFNNLKNKQKFPDNFEPTLIQLILHLYCESNFPEECKNQVIRLIAECFHLEATYSLIQILAKFLVQVYKKAIPNSLLNTNSSYAIYQMAMNFSSYSKRYYFNAKQFMDVFAYDTFRTYKYFFSSDTKGCINILSSIVALGKNKVLLPMELTYQLTIVASRFSNVTDIALMGIIYQVRHDQSKGIFEKSLINICQILHKCNNNQITAVYIIENCLRRSGTLSSTVIKKIEKMTKIQKCMSTSCQLLCKLYKNRIKKLKKQQSKKSDNKKKQ